MQTNEDLAMTIAIPSAAFDAGEPIPKKYTGDGEDCSPQLSWSSVPGGAKQLALICDDPDAPRPDTASVAQPLRTATVGPVTPELATVIRELGVVFPHALHAHRTGQVATTKQAQ